VSNNTPALGCISMEENKLLSILKWLNPKENPTIYIGESKNN
jgi:L,D-peptidoglycan transpeptidase YkuD (ErfK/YbiS/YcfS/YnhG family)